MSTPRNCSRHSSADASIMSITTGEALPSTRWSSSAITSSIWSSPRWNSARCHQLWTAKKLPSLQAGWSCVIQVMPSRRRSCISSTCATACQPQPSRGSSSTLEPAQRLGPRIVGGLLQAEGQHRQHRVVAGHAGVPVRLGTRDAVAQHARVAGEEVDLVAHLQRQQVLRVADAQVLEDAAGAVPLAVGQGTGRRHVQGLALGGRAARGGGMRLACRRQAGRLGAEQVQVGHQHMGHRHVRRDGQRGLGLGQRVVEVAAQQRAGGVVMFGGLGIGAAERVAVDVLDRHGSSS